MIGGEIGVPGTSQLNGTCDPTTDTAAYWAPTLIADGKHVAAIDAAVYYRRNTIAPVRAFPANLVMIGGNSSARTPQSTNVVFWGCSLADTSPSTTVPNCGSNSLRLHVIFPECWDGSHLDSADHKSQMAYATNGVCPVAIPAAFSSARMSDIFSPNSCRVWSEWTTSIPHT